ncbi:MAG: AAA family ATPase [Dehalococcoidales bacterium]|nr:AAA family ATPase [Dehalococcoidales bacterium]
MPNIIAEIKQWSTALPFWERWGLDGLISGKQYNDADCAELLQCLLEDEGLVSPAIERKELTHLNNTTDAAFNPSEPVSLKRVFNVQNVNALVPGQTLSFCDALTAIFGSNGSGKSGYARVLGCAGFTRGDRVVLPDINKPFNTDIVISADIEISCGTSTEIINYKVGSTCNKLSQCHVFDSTSVHVHLTGANSFSFSPAGLSLLTGLSDLTDSIKLKLQTKIDEAKKPQAFKISFQGKSSITEIIDNLGPKTDLKELKNQSQLSPAEVDLIKELDYEIAGLKTKKVTEQVSILQKAIQDLGKLQTLLTDISNKLCDSVAADLENLIIQHSQIEATVKILSIEEFKSDKFSQVGAAVWRQFVEAASELAKAEGSQDKPYPQPDDYCLLCHQPLSEHARLLITRLWEYLVSDAQSRLAKSAEAIEKKIESIQSIDMKFLNSESIYFRLLQGYDTNVLNIVTTFLAECQNRQIALLRILNTRKNEALTKLPDSGAEGISKIIENLQLEINGLKTQNVEQKITELENKLLTLHHRQILGQLLPDIEQYILKMIWAQKASRISCDTRHITQKYKALFENLVTDRYLELFEKILKDLQRPLRVSIKTIGKKGKTVKQIVLETDPTAPTDIATPEKVLSEGEKRAVALADFLTEVALDSTSRAIILDDPVTSLDLEWRETIASILIKECKKRQVIVFTHDLPFLYFLKKFSEDEQTEMVTHWIQRIENKPGYIFPNNSPALEKEYVKTARAQEFYEKAKASDGHEQEYFLRLGFAALRTCYEAFILYELFEEVVVRFDVRIMFGRLKRIKWDDSIADEANTKYEFLSRFIEGHLQSDEYTVKPDPQLLNQEIQSFNTLRTKLKTLKAKPK